MTEAQQIAEWLRGLHWTHPHYREAQFFAAAVERGEWKEQDDGE